MKVFLSLLTILFIGEIGSAGRYAVPPLNQSLVEFKSDIVIRSLGNEFSILVWNVHKGVDGQAWVDDMELLSHNADLFMIQEATDDDLMVNMYSQVLKYFQWDFAKSFTYTKTDESTGVATGSAIATEKSIAYRTQDVEPIVGTPKTVLISYLNLEDGTKVAVLNIHGLNRTTNAAFFRQIEESLALIKDHTGPVIYAGDFNTNNKSKLTGLDTRLAARGLKRHVFENDQRKHQLDWIYVQGCEVQQSEILYQIKTSDHLPLSARLFCRQK